ncbi:hypothetical protein CORC01_05683 [Colletotrichum orchidophilum]|uniref:Uncharacterized protein n=1 Tax=Colletotrichum orchidophilum TaxID=1209926 RepID=A0A1G4BC76_9PEZI|nr:uncharacterized protein CORC01_05683 [Colletotrichum orchidophilum]OHE98993.1 hypothetical protein CORC01_05683 [Colletotrichum orchidophilum]
MMTIEGRKGSSAKKRRCFRGGDWVSGAEGIYRVEEGISQYAAQARAADQVPQYSRIDLEAASESSLSEKSKARGGQWNVPWRWSKKRTGGAARNVTGSGSGNDACLSWGHPWKKGSGRRRLRPAAGEEDVFGEGGEDDEQQGRQQDAEQRQQQQRQQQQQQQQQQQKQKQGRVQQREDQTWKSYQKHQDLKLSPGHSESGAQAATWWAMRRKDNWPAAQLGVYTCRVRA